MAAEAGAEAPEGGVAGAVDIITRKALDFRKPLTAEVYLGGVYAELPKKTDPQVSGLVNWKNEANTVGVMVQAFSETRHLRRDGQRRYHYGIVIKRQGIAGGGTIRASCFDVYSKCDGFEGMTGSEVC